MNKQEINWKNLRQEIGCDLDTLEISFEDRLKILDSLEKIWNSIDFKDWQEHKDRLAIISKFFNKFIVKGMDSFDYPVIICDRCGETFEMGVPVYKYKKQNLHQICYNFTVAEIDNA